MIKRIMIICLISILFGCSSNNQSDNQHNKPLKDNITIEKKKEEIENINSEALNTLEKSDTFIKIVSSKSYLIRNEANNIKDLSVKYKAIIEFNKAFDKLAFKNSAVLKAGGNKVNFSVKFRDDGKGVEVLSDYVPVLSKSQYFIFQAKVPTGDLNKDLYINDTISFSNSMYNTNIRITSKTNQIYYNNLEQKRILTLSFSDIQNNEELLVNPDDVLENIHIVDNKDLCKAITFSKISGNDSKAGSVSFFMNIEENQEQSLINQEPKSCNIEITPFTFVNGEVMQKPYNLDISVYQLNPQLRILQEGALLSSLLDSKLTFESFGASFLNIEINKVLPDQIQHLITLTTSGGLNSADFYNASIYMFTEVKKLQLPISLNNNGKANYTSIDISKYSNNKYGLYYIKGTALNKDKRPLQKLVDYSSEYYEEYNFEKVYKDRLVLITDMTIIRKKNIDQSMDIFVSSISKGLPLSDIEVFIMGVNGLPVLSGKTNKDGYIHFSKLDFTQDKTPIAIVAKNKDDISFIPLSSKYEINYSSFDISGDHAGSKDDLKAMIFTDRGMYRPGEVVHINGIVKSYNLESISDGIPLTIVITDPNSKETKEKISLNKEGLFTIDFKTYTDFKTGNYFASCYISNGDEKDILIGREKFIIREFDTDTIRVSSKVIENNIPKGWLFPDNIQIEVSAENMTGTKAADRRIKAEIELKPISYNFDEYKDYLFIDPYIDITGKVLSYTPKIEDKRTDEKGKAVYDIGKILNQNDFGTFRLIFIPEVFEAGSGDGVSSYTTLNVSKAKYLAGVKKNNDFNYISQGSAIEAEFIAVDNNLNTIQLDKLKFRLLKKTSNRSIIKASNGTYRNQYTPKYTILSSGDFSISKNGTKAVLDTSQSGSFIYEILDEDIVIGRVSYYVSGYSNNDEYIEKDSLLKIKLNKKEYKYGDKIELDILAAYKGYGLITIESDKVYAYKWFKADSTLSSHSIDIPKDIGINGYVNVVYARDISSEDIYSSPLSYGVVPFSMDKSSYKLNIDLKAPERVYSGDEVTIEYSVDTDSKILLYAVDEGILQAAGYNLPNPLEYFAKKRSLGVETYQTIELILPDYKVINKRFSIGGGEASDNNTLKNKLNPFARKVNAPVVLWSGIIDVKANKKYQFKGVIPDYFNGSVKVMAVAISNNKMGFHQTSFIANNPIIIVPNMPYAVIPKDKFQLSLGVTNLIDNVKSSTIEITAEASKHLKITSDTKKILNIDQGKEQLVIFDVEALDELGEASITLYAKSKDINKTVSLNVTSSVRPQSPYTFKIDIGSFHDAKYSININQEELYNFQAMRIAGTSANPLWAVSGLIGYLDAYPYGCSEQITSKIYPIMLLSTISSSYSNKEVDDKYNYVIKELEKRQRGTKGFSLWNDSSYIDNFASIYIMQFLTDMKEMNRFVPNNLFSKGLQYLSNYLDNLYDIDDNYYYELEDKAFATYILARNGVIVTRYLTALEEKLDKLNNNKFNWKNSIAAAYIGASYMLLQNMERGKELLISSAPKYYEYKFNGDYRNSLLDNAVYIYLISKIDKSLIDNLAARIDFLMNSISNNYYNSISAAYSFAALYNIGKTMESITPNIIATPKNTIEKSLNNSDEFIFSSDTNNIIIDYGSKGVLPYYYYISTGGFYKNTISEDKGIKVSKQVLDKNGNPVTSGYQGDELTIVIDITRTDTSNSSSMMTAVTDLLAGSFEIIPDSVRSSYPISSTDMREDRAIFYIDLVPEYKNKISYKVKLLSSGDYTLPAVFAESMYRRNIYGSSSPAKFIVNAKY